MRRTLTAVSLAVLLAPVPLAAQRPDSSLIADLKWRSIGPANMGGRVSDLLANPHNPKVIYVAQATGGIWKSANAGVTWTPIFDATQEFSVSALAMAPSDTAIVWAGLGEENSRNSISPGSGVYKSTDAGLHWTYMGLRETQAIGRIAIDPRDPNVVYVAALGHPWGPNRERGLYKTTDGGQTWRLVKFISDRAGFVDVALDPSNPDVVWAASWERVRGPYFLKSGGPGSGLWKSTDAGEHWTRVTGNGFPTTTLGRIGIAVAPSNSQVVYAMVEADSNPNPASLRRGFVPDSTHRQQLQSGLYRSTDGGHAWTKMNDNDVRPFYFSQVRVDPRDPNRVYWMAEEIRFSNDGGTTQRRIGIGVHSDNHAFWIDPNDPDHYIVGDDGGVSQTYDRGRTYDALLQFPTGQFYDISADMQNPFWVCGGLQDNGSWCGPSRTDGNAIRNENWVTVNGGDGFYTAQDPDDPNIIFSESQGGDIERLDARTWERHGIQPGNDARDRRLEDSIIVWRGDTTQPVRPDMQHLIDSARTLITQDTAVFGRNRFNWETPFFLSSHNPGVIYIGGQRIWKSYDRGDHWMPVSGDLSSPDDTGRVRVSLVTTGGVTTDVTGAETYGTVVTMAESPQRAGILWAGTDDGNVWLTRDDGVNWENLNGRFPGVPAKTWVSRVATSPFDSATVYVAFDGHRDDNFTPFVFVSRDFGRTFRSIAAGLPVGAYVDVIREDPRRRGLLFLGTERGAFVSPDSGATWQQLGEGLPPVPVHDLLVHPRDRVLVAATHGRSIWTLDIGPLEEANDSALALAGYVFPVEPALVYNPRAGGGGVGAMGNRPFSTPNPPFGAQIAFRVVGGPPAPEDTAQERGFGGFGRFGRGARAARPDDIVFTITDAAGDTVRELRAPAGSGGIRWVTWDLRRNREPLSPSQVRDSMVAARRQEQVRDSVRAAMRADTTRRAPTRDPEPTEPGVWVNPNAAGGFGGGGGFFRFGQGPLVEPGEYVVTARINGLEYKRTIRVERPTNTSEFSGGWQ